MRSKEFWAFLRSATLKPHCPVHWKHLRYPVLPSMELSRILVFLNYSPFICIVDQSVTYLGTEINNKNELSPEIYKRIIAANRCFYASKSCLKSSFLKLRTKLLLYKSLIRSVLIYASDTWPLTLRDEEALGIFERKILRCILGGIQVNGSWRRSNLELYKIYKQPDIVKFVNLKMLKWAGHLARMNEDRRYKKLFLAKPIGNKPRGRPPLRWIDCVEKDLNILKVKN
ncbi:putative endonuclease-reverse transcriptase [Trichonephila clavipes]|nr:putative endonuclease-reverse transcriptase [Trichonephila clavipes]